MMRVTIKVYVYYTQKIRNHMERVSNGAKSDTTNDYEKLTPVFTV